MSTNSLSSKSAGAGLLSALIASLCCITPVFSLLVGVSGIAATFSWMEPLRPYLVVLTILVLVFAWYQKIKPKTALEIACACEDAKKSSFWQSRKFLAVVTVFAAIMLAFPYYADVFYPETNLSESVISNSKSSYIFEIKGMTCSGCEEHVKHEVSKLPSITKLEVSYDKGNAVVEFDESKIDLESIKSAIDKTGYKVESFSKEK
tara:strand:- start:86 stop:700 length:615 start_codon:yes stop_codon:yes gene_type:complete